MASQPIFPGSLATPAAQIQNSDGTSFVTLYTPGANGAKLESISATSTDTSAVVLQLAVTVSSVDYVIGEVSIPAGAGTDGSTKAVNVLNATDLPWLRDDGARAYMYLANGSVLKAKAKTTVTAGKAIQLFMQAGEF